MHALQLRPNCIIALYQVLPKSTLWLNARYLNLPRGVQLGRDYCMCKCNFGPGFDFWAMKDRKLVWTFLVKLLLACDTDLVFGHYQGSIVLWKHLVHFVFISQADSTESRLQGPAALGPQPRPLTSTEVNQGLGKYLGNVCINLSSIKSHNRISPLYIMYWDIRLWLLIHVIYYYIITLTHICYRKYTFQETNGYP